MKLLCLSQAYPPPWQPPPQEAKDDKILIIIAVLVVIFVVGPIILSAIMYVMVSGLIGGTMTGEPNVQLASPHASGTNQYRVAVAGVSEPRELYNFKAVLLKDYQLLEEMRPIGSPTANMTFTDLDGGGTLSVGDYFIITCDPGSEYTLSVIWQASGNERGNASWHT